MDDGGAQLFVQLCGEPAYDQRVVDGKLYLSLHGARFRSANDRRSLDVRYFETALARVSSFPETRRKGRNGQNGEKRRARGGNGVEMTMTFKAGAAPREGTARVVAGKDGFNYLYVDFPEWRADGTDTNTRRGNDLDLDDER
jgi:hypothetical protein